MPLTNREVPTRMRIVNRRASLDDVMKCYADGFKPDIWKYEYFCDAAKGQVVFELYIEETEEARDATGKTTAS